MADDSKAKLAKWLGGAAIAATAAAYTASQEGTVLRVYRDPVDILTACTGETHYIVSPGDIVPGATFTREECSDALMRSMWEHAQPVIQCGGDKLTTGQKVAFLDFNFNTGHFCGSTIAKRAKAGDVAGSCEAILMWKFAGGKDCSQPVNWGPHGCKGVWTRRLSERSVCLGNIPG